MKKIMILTLIIAVLVSNFSFANTSSYGFETYDQGNKTQIFIDVPVTHWAFEATKNLNYRSIIKGYPDGKFYGDRYVTNAEFSKMLAVALDIKPDATANIYSDLSDSWCKPYANVVGKYMPKLPDNQFMPNRLIKRYEVISAIVKATHLNERNIPDQSLLEIFSDSDSVPYIYRNDMALGLEFSLVSGFSDSTIRASALVSRFQMAALLNRMSNFGDVGSPASIVPVATTTPVPVIPTPAPITIPVSPYVPNVDSIFVNIRDNSGASFIAPSDGTYTFTLIPKGYTPFYLQNIPLDGKGHFRCNILVFNDATVFTGGVIDSSKALAILGYPNSGNDSYTPELAISDARNLTVTLKLQKGQLLKFCACDDQDYYADNSTIDMTQKIEIKVSSTLTPPTIDPVTTNTGKSLLDVNHRFVLYESIATNWSENKRYQPENLFITSRENLDLGSSVTGEIFGVKDLFYDITAAEFNLDGQYKAISGNLHLTTDPFEQNTGLHLKVFDLDTGTVILDREYKSSTATATIPLSMDVRNVYRLRLEVSALTPMTKESAFFSQMLLK